VTKKLSSPFQSTSRLSKSLGEIIGNYFISILLLTFIFIFIWFGVWILTTIFVFSGLGGNPYEPGSGVDLVVSFALRFTQADFFLKLFFGAFIICTGFHLYRFTRSR
jgi:hypothetical protein